MTCRIIALMGSRKKKGNTSLLLDQAVRGAEAGGCEVERIAFDNLDLEAAMDAVSAGGPLPDDGTRGLYKKFQDADGIIVASPVYTMGVPGRLKSLMDLFLLIMYSASAEKASLVPESKRGKRKGLFISLAGSSGCPTVFEGSVTTVTAFFGGLDFHYHGDLLVDDMDTILDLHTRPEVLKSAYDKGFALAKALKNQKR
jgi:multimeric flavodoxin WrbA